MAFTRAQLNNIMMHRGQAFIPRDKLAYSGRVCETYLRRKQYRLEDRAALAEFKLVQAAYRDIREIGLRLADNLHVDALKNDAPSLQWKRQVKQYIEQRCNTLTNEIAYNAYQWSTLAYTASFYGRQWLLDSLLPNVDINYQRLNRSEVGQSVLQPALEAVSADRDAYERAGNEWRDSYAMAVGLSSLKAQRSISSIMGDTSPFAALMLVGNALGTNPKKPTGLYAATSILTRTNIGRASTHATVAAYQWNVTLIPALMWVTSHDHRVCPVCSRLEGTIYPLEGLAGLILFSLPPDGSHFGCRCGVTLTLVPTLEKEASEEPPEDSYEEWAAWFGVANELDDYFEDDRLMSTQL